MLALKRDPSQTEVGRETAPANRDIRLLMMVAGVIALLVLYIGLIIFGLFAIGGVPMAIHG